MNTLLKKLTSLLTLIAVLTWLIWPGLANGQNIDIDDTDLIDATELDDSTLSDTTGSIGSIDLSNLDLLLGTNPYLNTPSVLLPPAEQALWQTALDNSTLDQYDKRLTAQTLPLLGREFGPMVAQSLLGYTQKGRDISREFAGAKNTSQRATGKAAAITAIGTTVCSTETLFSRSLNPATLLWVHQQTGQTTHTSALNQFFGRSFDMVARQSFWQEGRAFTNSFIAPTDWSDFLQAIGRGSLEQQFALEPSSLQNIPTDQLTETVGRLHFASQLGLPDIPEAENEEEFYTQLGQWRLEQTLGLPRHSFVGQTWQEIYRHIGFRGLEDQLTPQLASDHSPFETTETVLTENERFTALAEQLTQRGLIYTEPLRALGLPTEEILATTEGQSTLYERLINGDPQAFATAGAYFLADNLNLPLSEIRLLLARIDLGNDRPISLAQARPVDSQFQTDQLFSAESTAETRQQLFYSLGQAYRQQIESRLPQVNESVLLAITGNNTNPTYQQVISVITNGAQRDTTFQTIGEATAQESLVGQLTEESLEKYGAAQLAETFDVATTDITNLSDPNRNDSDPTIKATGILLDSGFGWPEGTAARIAKQEINPESVAATLIQGSQLLLGATRLWEKLGLDEDLITQLNELYFTSEAPTEDELDEETSPTPSIDDEELIDPEGTDEYIEFAIPVEEQPFAEAVSTELRIPLEAVDSLLTGRFRTTLLYLTLTQIANELAGRSTITPSKLIHLLEQPSIEATQTFLAQTELLQESTYVSPTLYAQLEAAIGENNLAGIWSALINEVVYQWNITCPDKQAETKTAITNLVETLVDLPADPADGTASQTATRPIQLFTYSTTNLPAALMEKVQAAYPGLGRADIKWGLYAAPRAWNHLYIGY